ncbi:spherulation-specific family 4 protein [Streptomyces sp. FXJ1.172]|uniref:spherulation-specific family 4 protein n=1 Tax=Streptomyces sp. FXJ1.172 TaxID=710705 RepID=UPI0007D013C0|nr:spherulation-specific family 4 protein [Streptomyces sp. FXJ1.172]WEO97878.1 spherulation-specific family 4 protein [Streptomyces sp. FXJ1.172]
MNTLLVPYYEHPSVRPAEWAAILAAAPRVYGVVLNPASGPGERPDAVFAGTAGRLRAAGVTLLGYVDTGYARRPYGNVVSDLTRHRAWYGTQGVFLDQVSAGIEELGWYERLATVARALGCGPLVLNHGTAPHPAYAALADVLVTFEGPWTAYRRTPPHPRAYPSGVLQAHLVYGVPPGADVAGAARERGAAVHCAVPGAGAHPWGTLPVGVAPAR